MKRLLITAAAVLVSATIACQRSSTAPSPSSAGSVGVSSIAIHGPDRLAPGQAARFTATASMRDGSTQDVTRQVSWVALPRSVLTIERTTGEAAALASGDASIWVETNIHCCGPIRMAVLVLPPNTYRITGRVRESGLPLQGATVTVLSGTGSGQSVVTDYDGQYRLYGVAGALRIEVSKPGYVELVKDFMASDNAVLDFPEARQVQAAPSISGAYVLTLQADSGCPTASTDPRTPHLPAETQRARSYAVQITQEGPALDVAGVGPDFLPPSDRFAGRIMPQGIEFGFGDGYIGYGPDNAFTAYISPTQALSYEGRVYAALVGSAIVGRLDGLIQLFEKSSSIYRQIGQCHGGHHRFSMTAGAGSPR